MPEESRSTALDPDLLTAEIGLLLDYLSGLPERILTDHPHGQLPHGSATYDEALSRYFPIDAKVRGGESLQPSDLQFLLELRDYLNSWAAPATGASIAFTTLVTRKSPEARKGKADAERAYPEWIPMATALRWYMAGMMVLAVCITFSIVLVATYIYLGNTKAANIADINAHINSLSEEILREEAAAVSHSQNDGIKPYCADVKWVPEDAKDPKDRVQAFNTVAQQRLCTRFGDLSQKLTLAYNWLWFIFPKDDRALPALTNVLKGYVLPILMGLLGSMTYVLRRYLRSVGERLLSPRDLREYIVRLVLGTVFGVAIGFFSSGSSTDVTQQVIATPISSLGAPALAFLAGYSVEAVFQMLDKLADQFAADGSKARAMKGAP